MQLTIRFSGRNRSDMKKFDYEEILSSALERFQNRLKQVNLFIEDVNGPRGGIDKQCRCVMYVPGMAPIVISDKDESMRSLIHRVANRAAYAISQKFDRRKKRVKQNRHLKDELASLPLSQSA